MRILFISDIHANLEALKTIENTIQSVDLTICLGDIAGYQCNVNEVIEILRKYNVTCIQGNHDRYVIEGLKYQEKVINDSVRFGIEHAIKVISSDNLLWLKSLPISIALKEDNLSILCCHGSPWNVTNGYVYENSPLLSKMDEFAFDIIALGHTHREFIQFGIPIVFNPGSVGQARDHEGMVCAKILDTKTKNFETIKMPYDFQKEINYSISLGAENWIYKHFKTVLNEK